ncbi:zinc carboxypeptidase [Thelonectria olida]|uniref:Zinc carboxypeptidase n=1 Tax=Thelonectria olida TaxID=1576542 RepID=A0A9P8VUP0_9HYPO|nr:zinc carboxypeptidase [Thelonectria olida]
MYLVKLLVLSGVLPLAAACFFPSREEANFTSHHARAVSFPIYSGDRFNGGTVAPRGLGSQPSGTKIDGIMNVEEIRTALDGLVNEFGIESFTSPDQTHDGATMFGGKVGNGLDCDDAYRVFLMAGIHACERGGPDNLIYFISDLLWAQREGTGLTYGRISYTNDDVLTALSTGIVFMPLVNPDGVVWDQSTNTCWRKNRNPAGQVDLNRNFDWLWDFKTTFAPNRPDSVASENPLSDTYHGASPFSEPETRNVKSVMDTFTKLRWFVDLHSYSGLVLWPWGDDTNQGTLDAQNFNNPAFDGKRGVIPDEPGLQYKEYISFPDWDTVIVAATKVAEGMGFAAERHYDARQSTGLYPTSGISTDYAFGRHVVDKTLSKIYGFTIEFGFHGPVAGCGFYPSDEQFHLNVIETGAGFMEFLLTAARQGLGSPRECPSGTSGLLDVLRDSLESTFIMIII